jgi:hypothetical protein
MTEAFLHYVWQYQYFSKADLYTTDGDTVSIFHAGHRNTHSGPDFFNARVKIGDMEWIGNVEIHIDASGWIDHDHDSDRAYDNVILHVVWKEDKKIKRNDDSLLPTIELKDRIADTLLLHYRKLLHNPEKIPCASVFDSVSSLTKYSMLDKALMQRLESKATSVMTLLKRNNNDWEETAYQMLCRNFGFKVNADPFEQLALSLPYKVIMKHSDKLLQIEALLFGQAGFLEGSQEDEYFLLLKREYALLGKKFGLLEKGLNKSQWKFLRLRPANFPTIRLAQLASLLSTQKNIFSKIHEAPNYAALVKIFSVTQSSYWRHHYSFFRFMEDEIAPLGEMSISNILVNTAVPLMVAYGKARDEQYFVDRAIDILQHIPSEENTIIRNWSGLGLKSKSSFDSQALLELNNNFCLKRRCLDCNIGFSILQQTTA